MHKGDRGRAVKIIVIHRNLHSLSTEEEAEEPNDANNDDTENEYSGKAISCQAATS